MKGLCNVFAVTIQFPISHYKIPVPDRSQVLILASELALSRRLKHS
jgi:hypothetical protein